MDETGVKTTIAEFLGRRPDEIRQEVVLRELVEESFVLVELVIELQEVYGIQLHGQDLEGVTTVGQLLEVVRRAAARPPRSTSEGPS